MAYTPNTLIMRYGGFIEGSFNVWEYTTTDSLATVTGTGYFTDGSSKGMQVGDLVWYVNATVLTAVLCQCSAITINTSAGLSQHVGSSTIQQSNSTSDDEPLDVLQAGDFTVNPWQLGSPIQYGSTVTTGPDRFFGVTGTSGAGTMARVSNTAIAGFTAACAFGRSASDTHTVGHTFGQVVETLNSIRVQGKALAVSFYAQAGANWAPTSTSGATNGALTATLLAAVGGIDDSAANAAAGSWTGVVTVGQTTITPTTTIGRYVFGGTVPATATQLAVLFNYLPLAASTAGANENVQLMAIQAKIGADNGIYIHRDAGSVLELVQRYLQVVEEPAAGVAIASGVVQTATTATLVLPLSVAMRKAPTVTLTQGLFNVLNGANAYTATALAGTGVTTGIGNCDVVSLKVTTATGMTAGSGAVLTGSAGTGVITIRAGYEG